jgi:hypothetical protein
MLSMERKLNAEQQQQLLPGTPTGEAGTAAH